MKLSQAIAKARDIVVEFEAASLRVTYRPTSFTVRELDRLTEEQANAGGKPTRNLLEMVKKTVITWDLTDDYDRLIPLDRDLDDQTDPLRDVPSVVFTEIMKKVNEDQQPGGAKTSGVR